jgi:hypothetical protein
MQLFFTCPKCDTVGITDATESSRVLKCHSCDWHRQFPATDIKGETPLRCLACGNEDLWRQKDFPQGLGLLMVIAGATMATIAWAWYEPLISMGILMVFALIDMLLFVFMKDVLVCYRCRARHRKAEIPDDHPRFDLELNERYRQEEKRLTEAEGRPPGSV